MTPNELRAEAAGIDEEEGTDCTTRACLLRGAADEIETWQRKYSGVLTFMDDVKNMARNRNPHGCTILDFMAVWNDQYQSRLGRLEKENERIDILERLLYEARDLLSTLRGHDLRDSDWERYPKWLQEVDFQIISPPTPTPEDCEDD